jgi:hypothetical protein
VWFDGCGSDTDHRQAHSSPILLLILDEVGFVPFDRTADELLFTNTRERPRALVETTASEAPTPHLPERLSHPSCSRVRTDPVASARRPKTVHVVSLRIWPRPSTSGRWPASSSPRFICARTARGWTSIPDGSRYAAPTVGERLEGLVLTMACMLAPVRQEPRASLIPVKTTLRLPRRATYTDYLAAEETSQRRHEFIDGVIVAMAGGSDEHNAIASRFAGLFMLRLPRGCRSGSPGLAHCEGVSARRQR